MGKMKEKWAEDQRLEAEASHYEMMEEMAEQEREIRLNSTSPGESEWAQQLQSLAEEAVAPKDKGLRYNQGKLRWRNFPLFLVRPLVGVGDAAEKREGNPTGKYPTFNFLKGLSALDCLDSLTRHLDEFEDPDMPDIDPEDGQHVLAKVAWNALVCLYHITKNPDVYDDRYKGIQNDNFK